MADSTPPPDHSEEIASDIQAQITQQSALLGRPLTNQEKLVISDQVKQKWGIQSNYSAPLPQPPSVLIGTFKEAPQVVADGASAAASGIGSAASAVGAAVSSAAGNAKDLIRNASSTVKWAAGGTVAVAVLYLLTFVPHRNRK